MGTRLDPLLREGLDEVDRSIQSAAGVDQITANILDTMLHLFGGTRVWLLDPCDPEASSWHVAIERAQPGGKASLAAVGREFSMSPEVARVLAAAHHSDRPVHLGGDDVFAEAAHPSDPAWKAASTVATAVYAKLERPHLLVWQSSSDSAFTPEKEQLFTEVGRRVGQALTSVSLHRRLRDNERNVEQAERAAELGYWERDFVLGCVRGSMEALRILGLPIDPREQDLAQWHQRWCTIVHPADRAKAERAMTDAVGGGAPYDVDYRVVRPNGDIRLVHSRADLIRDEAGRPQRMVGFLQDITARTRMEEQLLEMSDRFRMLSESALTGIYLIEEGRFRYVNEALAQTFGYTAADLIERMGPAELVHPDDRARVTEHMHLLLSGEDKETRYDNRAVRKDGVVVTVEVQCRRFQHGDRSGVIGTMLDITERKRLEQQLREAQKMEAIGRLAGGIAHDFNNLLMVIQGSAELTRIRLGASHPAQELLGEINHAVDRAADLTRQLLAFGRRQVLREQVVDLNKIITQVGALLRRLIGEDIQLVLALDEALALTKVDPDQVAHAIINLTVNARDAMPQGGRLTIATHNVDLETARGELQPGRYVMVTVSDTGHGIDEAVAAQIFEPFFTTKPVGKGTGLGLAMVYGFLKQSGGHVEVDSGIGRGATFRLYLPRSEERVSHTPRASDASAVPRGAATVLLVEDDNAVRQLCRLVLEGNGHVVLEAGDGQDALEIARQHQGRIDVVVTDIVMPRLSGPRLADRLRVMYPDTRILFLSGYADDALPPQLDPRSDFLQKPFPPAALLKKVRQLLDVPGPGAPALKPPAHH